MMDSKTAFTMSINEMLTFAANSITLEDAVVLRAEMQRRTDKRNAAGKVVPKRYKNVVETLDKAIAHYDLR